MEPQNPLRCSKQLSIRPYAQPDESNTYHGIIFV
jgi:hypothetical protein